MSTGEGVILGTFERLIHRELQAQFEEIYNAHERSIVRYVAMRLSDQALVQDVASHTFLRMWEKMRLGERIDNHRAFLYKIARGLIYDEYRKRGRRGETSIDTIDEALLIDESDPTRETEEFLIKKKIVEVVRTLKSEYHDVIVMHYIDDMPIRDIAVALDESENLVRVRLHRALESVRKYFNHA